MRTPDNSYQLGLKEGQTKTALLATLYVAPAVKDGILPPPFAIADEYRKSGWTVEPLRLADVSADKLNQINQMLSEVK